MGRRSPSGNSRNDSRLVPDLATHGTFRTWRDVGFESVLSSKADVNQALPFKLIFFVLVDGWSLVAGSLVKRYGG